MAKKMNVDDELAEIKDRMRSMEKTLHQIIKKLDEI